jgi:hypothetical protein
VPLNLKTIAEAIGMPVDGVSRHLEQIHATPAVSSN